MSQPTAEPCTSLDLRILLGEIPAVPAVPCEHATHGSDSSLHDSGTAAYYVSGACPACCQGNGTWAVCRRFIEVTLAAREFECPDCHWFGPTSDCITILGPVNS